MVEAQAMLAQSLVERTLAGVTKGRVPDIVYQRKRLGQVGVQLQRIRKGARDLRNFHRVRQARAEMVRRLARTSAF